MNRVCTLSPKRIILGGGVMKHPDLLPMVRRKLLAYIESDMSRPDVVHPALGDNAGVLGAIALAQSTTTRCSLRYGAREKPGVYSVGRRRDMTGPGDIR